MEEEEQEFRVAKFLARDERPEVIARTFRERFFQGPSVEGRSGQMQEDPTTSLVVESRNARLQNNDDEVFKICLRFLM